MQHEWRICTASRGGCKTGSGGMKGRGNGGTQTRNVEMRLGDSVVGSTLRCSDPQRLPSACGGGGEGGASLRQQPARCLRVVDPICKFHSESASARSSRERARCSVLDRVVSGNDRRERLRNCYRRLLLSSGKADARAVI